MTHVTVVDVNGGPALANTTVLVTRNRISAVGAAGKITIPQEAQIIDGSGKFMIPGLWDMHVHWYEHDYYSLFLANGVTGIRMM